MEKIHYNDIKKTASNREDYINNLHNLLLIKIITLGQIINTFLLIEDKPENLFSESELSFKIGINEKEYKLLSKFNFEKLRILVVIKLLKKLRTNR